MMSFSEFPTDDTSKRLCEVMKRRYPEIDTCDFVVKSPGRVNLIGEHIDYSGYAVLPMALNQAVYIAVSILPSKTPAKLRIRSENKSMEGYEGDFEEALKFANQEPPSPLKWYHYALCGLRGFYDYAKDNSDWKLPSLCLLVGYGNEKEYLPMNAGLSSSSALVVAAALALMKASKLSVKPTVMAELCAKCERLIGTMGGGMDQAACLLAKSSAIFIEFTKPTLTTTPVKIPKGGVFVIADSGARLNKAATPDYNTRVSQCREAAILLMKNLSMNKDFDAKELTLSDVQRAYGKSQPGEMIGLNSPWSETFSGDMAKSIPAYRSLHCFSESQRVLDFKRICDEEEQRAGDGGDHEEALRKLGDLMNASHESCRELYNCSCPELDRLVQICRSAGSYGSRLTGAGWGGCAVSLVSESRIQQFMDTVAKEYYNASPEAASQKLFYTAPGRSAGFVNCSVE